MNLYSKIIERAFFLNYTPGAFTIPFNRDDIEIICKELSINVPKNLGDVIYSFKYRTPLPESVVEKAPENMEWIIQNVGRSKYAFCAVKEARILPDHMLMKIKILDATPGIVQKHSLTDEQALLTKIRYNRLLDIFSGVTCYSLQNHLRTTVKEIGQVETDELYVGIDDEGKQYIFPVQAKGGKDELGVSQIKQDIALCFEKYPDLICKAIATQFITDSVIAIFEFKLVEGEIKKIKEKHYELVHHDEMTTHEIRAYNDFPDLRIDHNPLTD